MSVSNRKSEEKFAVEVFGCGREESASELVSYNLACLGEVRGDRQVRGELRSRT